MLSWTVFWERNLVLSKVVEVQTIAMWRLSYVNERYLCNCSIGSEKKIRILRRLMLIRDIITKFMIAVSGVLKTKEAFKKESVLLLFFVAN